MSVPRDPHLPWAGAAWLLPSSSLDREDEAVFAEAAPVCLC